MEMTYNYEQEMKTAIKMKTDGNKSSRKYPFPFRDHALYSQVCVMIHNLWMFEYGNVNQENPPYEKNTHL